MNNNFKKPLGWGSQQLERVGFHETEHFGNTRFMDTGSLQPQLLFSFQLGLSFRLV